MEEGYIQVVEERGVDSGHEVFQITTNSEEPQLSENRKEIACRTRWASASTIRATSRRFEFNDKSFEPCQNGEAIGHHFG